MLLRQAKLVTQRFDALGIVLWQMKALGGDAQRISPSLGNPAISMELDYTNLGDDGQLNHPLVLIMDRIRLN